MVLSLAKVHEGWVAELRHPRDRPSFANATRGCARPIDSGRRRPEAIVNCGLFRAIPRRRESAISIARQTLTNGGSGLAIAHGLVRSRDGPFNRRPGSPPFLPPASMSRSGSRGPAVRVRRPPQQLSAHAWSSRHSKRRLTENSLRKHMDSSCFPYCRQHRPRDAVGKAASVKVCGCRPHEGGAARTGAGVRKPPMEETAGGVGWPGVRRYGDFGVGSLLPRWVGSFFGRRSRVRRSGSVDCKGQNRSCVAEMERHGDGREQRDGEHGRCRSIARSRSAALGCCIERDLVMMCRS
jgi:hypothetical protein